MLKDVLKTRLGKEQWKLFSARYGEGVSESSRFEVDHLASFLDHWGEEYYLVKPSVSLGLLSSKPNSLLSRAWVAFGEVVKGAADKRPGDVNDEDLVVAFLKSLPHPSVDAETLENLQSQARLERLAKEEFEQEIKREMEYDPESACQRLTREDGVANVQWPLYCRRYTQAQNSQKLLSNATLTGFTEHYLEGYRLSAFQKWIALGDLVQYSPWLRDAWCDFLAKEPDAANIRKKNWRAFAKKGRFQMSPRQATKLVKTFLKVLSKISLPELDLLDDGITARSGPP